MANRPWYSFSLIVIIIQSFMLYYRLVTVGFGMFYCVTGIQHSLVSFFHILLLAQHQGIFFCPERTSGDWLQLYLISTENNSSFCCMIYVLRWLLREKVVLYFARMFVTLFLVYLLWNRILIVNKNFREKWKRIWKRELKSDWNRRADGSTYAPIGCVMAISWSAFFLLTLFMIFLWMWN